MITNTQKETHENWVTAKELCEHFKLARSTMEVLIRRGLPCIKLGRNRRFKLSEVEEWLKTKQ